MESIILTSEIPAWPNSDDVIDGIKQYISQNNDSYFDREISISEDNRKQYFEYMPREIAQRIGQTEQAVQGILRRAPVKFYRRLLILTLMNQMDDDKICDIIEQGPKEMQRVLCELYSSVEKQPNNDTMGDQNYASQQIKSNHSGDHNNRFYNYLCSGF